MKNTSTPSFIVRQPRNVEELEALLRVRYQAFKESELSYYVPENETGMDADEWDKQATHFGLWKEDASGETAIGYLRIIGLNKSKDAEMVHTIGRKNPALSARIERKAKGPIRFMDMYAGNEAADDWFQQVEKDNFDVVEASRLSVLRQYHQFNVGQKLIETALSVFLNGDRAAYGAMEVMDHHLPFYRHYGFQDIANKFHPGIMRTSHLVVGHYEELPERFRQRLTTIRNTWESTGCMRFEA